MTGYRSPGGVVGVVLALTVLATGCGTGGRPGSPPPTVSIPSSPSVPNTAVSTPPADQEGPVVTLRGTVERADTNPACIVFRTDAGQQFMLAGPSAKSVTGPMRVEVTGRIGRNQVTACMVGRPFLADSLKQNP